MGANWDPLTKTILSLMKGSGSPEVVFHVTNVLSGGDLLHSLGVGESIEALGPLLRECENVREDKTSDTSFAVAPSSFALSSRRA